MGIGRVGLLLAWAACSGGCAPAKSADGVAAPAVTVTIAAAREPEPPAAAARADDDLRDVDLRDRIQKGEPAPRPPEATLETKLAARNAFMKAREKLAAGDSAGALALFREAESLYPGASPKYHIAVCLEQLGRYRGAIAAYETFIQSNPSGAYRNRVQQAQQRIAALRAKLP